MVEKKRLESAFSLEHYPSNQDVSTEIKDFFKKHWIDKQETLEKNQDPFGLLKRLEVLVIREDLQIAALRVFSLSGSTSTSITAPEKRRQGLGTLLINKSIEMVIAHNHPHEPVIKIYPTSKEGKNRAEAAKEKFRDQAYILIRSSTGL